MGKAMDIGNIEQAIEKAMDIERVMAPVSHSAISGVTIAMSGEGRVTQVSNNATSIEVVTQGQGPVLVMLPSRGRDSLDYEEVAQGLAGLGYTVLRPQPRGIGNSTGRMDGLTLHDLADDVAMVIRAFTSEPCIIIGHAFGNWVARMTAVDYPELVRGVVIAAAGGSTFPPILSQYVTRSADTSLPQAERLDYLKKTFFAPGSDPTVWLDGWYPEATKSQRAAADATRQEEWWSGGVVPLLDLQAECDPFKPASMRYELKEQFGDRITIATVPDASHALLPEQPQRVVDAIADWLATLNSVSASTSTHNS